MTLTILFSSVMVLFLVRYNNRSVDIYPGSDTYCLKYTVFREFGFTSFCRLMRLCNFLC